VKKVPAASRARPNYNITQPDALFLFCCCCCCLLAAGEFKLSKVKKVPAASRARLNPFFWRYSFDSASMQVLTDRPVTDFVVQ
jgi:hypothetical protein